MSYCTVQHLKNTLDIVIADGDTVTAPLLERIIEASSEWIDNFCGWGNSAFKASTQERNYNSDFVRKDKLFLDIPIVELEELRNGDKSSISLSDVQLLPLNASRYFQIRLLSGVWSFPQTDSSIKVTGKFGYSLVPPDTIREATIMLSGWIYKRYLAGLQTNTVSPELGTVLYGSSMPSQVKDILRYYVNGKKFL
jgi:hypothetical protein